MKDPNDTNAPQTQNINPVTELKIAHRLTIAVSLSEMHISVLLRY